jgi:hypothetical protein
MIWDDISGFSAGGKEQLSLCGVSPIAADLILFNVPGVYACMYVCMYVCMLFLYI